ncbi:MAG: polyphosphate kinase 1 [Polyangiaceae bacterium]|jgi:polyphosphate kinase|nr:polyphosphate kinase 1 [Polyangiaceae bacterium]
MTTQPEANVALVSEVPPSTRLPAARPSAETPPEGVAATPALTDATYINRELSWLEFNARVLAEAENPATPLYERVKFLGIVATNLDEFFMVRVAGLKQQLHGEVSELAPDGSTPAEQLAAISARAHELIDASFRIWNDDLRPAVAREGVVLVRPDELAPADLELLDKKFRCDIFPVLTPIAIDPNHPFPHLKNKSINLGVMFSREHEGVAMGFGVVQVPPVLDRVMPVRVAGARHAFVLLEDVIARHVHALFPSFKVRGYYAFRVTRNWDIEVDEEEGEDLLQTIQQELRRRDRGSAVRVEIAGTATTSSITRLCRALKLNEREDVYRSTGPLHLADLGAMLPRDDRRDLRDEAYAPLLTPPLRETDDFFAAIRERDVLLHHPYESFDLVVEFLARAADDPNVLAIKQTLYRAGGDSPVVRALARAAENGKQVTAVVELKARFDEESNIRWANALENSGVHVVYGLQGLKTHAKALLVVRREKDKLRRYVHLATGNYNPSTARLYTDLSLFTAREDVGEDLTAFFNLLTGYSAASRWNHLVVAPLGLHEAVLALIEREAEHARAGRPARLVAKMNACVDERVISALYGAAAAGVQIDLLVRGICCLRPGVGPGAERIRVRAVVDRFLEHTRVFWFANGGAEEVYLSSADWMPRNFRRRVELMVPVLDPQLRARVTQEVLSTMLADNVKAWELAPDGRYTRVEPAPGEPLVRSQARFIELTRERLREAEAHGRFQLARARLMNPLMQGNGQDRPRRKRRAEATSGPVSSRWRT